VTQPPFVVLDVSDWRVAAEEPSGDDPKCWLAHPTTRVRWLFKPVIINGERIQGEDWAEKAACELAKMISVPCAEVEMALRHETPGALSRNLRPDDYEMHQGDVVLSDLVEGYEPGAYDRRGLRTGHNLSNIQRALQDSEPPPGGLLPPDFTGFDTFVGILVLDAWIANRDRHDQNWSMLYPRTDGHPVRLCGAYDQAGCLGFNLPDLRRQQILEQGRVTQWVERGTAWRFEHTGNPSTLVALAHQALGMVSSDVRQYWISHLSQVRASHIEDLMDRIPNLSDPARMFAIEVLRVNKGRLLDGYV
jgi:hypothetical protein